jgi:hypothetical protein
MKVLTSRVEFPTSILPSSVRMAGCSSSSSSWSPALIAVNVHDHRMKPVGVNRRSTQPVSSTLSPPPDGVRRAATSQRTAAASPVAEGPGIASSGGTGVSRASTAATYVSSSPTWISNSAG